MVGFGSQMGTPAPNFGASARLSEFEVLTTKQGSLSPDFFIDAKIKGLSRAVAKAILRLPKTERSDTAAETSSKTSHKSSQTADARAPLNGQTQTQNFQLSGHVRSVNWPANLGINTAVNIVLSTPHGLVNLEIQPQNIQGMSDQLRIGQAVTILLPELGPELGSELEKFKAALKQLSSPPTSNGRLAAGAGQSSPTVAQHSTASQEPLDLPQPISARVAIARAVATRTAPEGPRLTPMIAGSSEANFIAGSGANSGINSEINSGARLNLSSQLAAGNEATLRLGPDWSATAPTLELKPGVRIFALSIAKPLAQTFSTQLSQTASAPRPSPDLSQQGALTASHAGQKAEAKNLGIKNSGAIISSDSQYSSRQPNMRASGQASEAPKTEALNMETLKPANIANTRIMSAMGRDAQVIHQVLKDSPNQSLHLHRGLPNHLMSQSQATGQGASQSLGPQGLTLRSPDHQSINTLHARGTFKPIEDLAARSQTTNQATSQSSSQSSRLSDSLLAQTSRLAQQSGPISGSTLGHEQRPSSQAANMATADTTTANTVTANTAANLSAKSTSPQLSRQVLATSAPLSSATSESVTSELEILSIRPSGSQHASAASSAQDHTIKTGQITGLVASGRPVMRSGIETLVLNTQIAPPKGTELTFRTLTDQNRLQVHGDVNLSLSGAENPAFSRDQSWRALESMIAQLSAHDPAALSHIREFSLPQPGRDLTTQLVVMLFALRKGGAKAWLGQSSFSTLDRIGASALGRRIRAEFPSLRRDSPERSSSSGQSEWKSVLFPLETEAGLCPVFFEWSNESEAPPEDEGVELSLERFCFRLNLETSPLGHVQVDGALQDQTLLLSMQSEIELSEPDQNELRDIIEQAAASFDIQGKITFDGLG